MSCVNGEDTWPRDFFEAHLLVPVIETPVFSGMHHNIDIYIYLYLYIFTWHALYLRHEHSEFDGRLGQLTLKQDYA